MTEYKCGHSTSGVIVLEDSVLSMCAYFDWAEDEGVFGKRTICWDCYCDKHFPRSTVSTGEKKCVTKE